MHVSGVLDYARSFVTFFTNPSQGGNIARIQVDAIATVEGWGADGGPETFYLIAPCRSEKMYVPDAPLFQMPNYEFSGIFTADKCSILRTHWTSDRESLDVYTSTDRFHHVNIDLTPMMAERFENDTAAVDATLANRRLVARTILRDEATGTIATLEYPIKTMNVRQNPDNYQVDTGPLIIPRFDLLDQEPIIRFDVAHVVYWTSDYAEFVLRRPHTVGEKDGVAVQVTDYSEIRIEAAENEIWGEIA
jgi:hypothetical protein